MNSSHQIWVTDQEKDVQKTLSDCFILSLVLNVTPHITYVSLILQITYQVYYAEVTA